MRACILLYEDFPLLSLSLITGLQQECEYAAACVLTTDEGWWHVMKCGSIPLMEDGIEGIKLDN